MGRTFMTVVSFAVLLSSCAVPMTTAEHREAAKAGAALLTFETFEVNRPLAEVTKTFKAKGAECLSFKLGVTKKPLIGVGSSTQYYAQTTQTVLTLKDRTELHFQVKYHNMLGKEPEGGSYFLVADAYPVSKNRTRVDIYRRTSVEVLARAVRGWASGQNMGCPDPSTYL